MHTRYRAVSAASTLLFALACGKSPDGPPPASGPALRIISGAGLADTIQATPSRGLLVEVRGATGKPDSGLVVLFEAPLRSSSSYSGCQTILLSSAHVDVFACAGDAITGADGRGLVRTRMGAVAGPVSVRITVGKYGLTDSAAFTVLPGAATAVHAVIRDTTVDLGSTFTPPAGLVDRAGNLRSDPVTFEATSPAVQVSGAGAVSAVAVGLAYVRVRGTVGGATGIDSTGIVVVPTARVAVSESVSIRLKSLGGAAVRFLVAGYTYNPAWSPTGERIAYNTMSGLATIDTLGPATPLVTPGVTQASRPEYSRDGLWIYFDGNGGNGRQIFRVHPDGTGLEPLLSPADADTGSYASPSPDGTRVAFTNGRNLLVKALATGHVDTLTTARPSWLAYIRWSPDGSWIAYNDGIGMGGLGLVRPDGSGQHRFAAYPNAGLTWSPDSKWLVGAYTDGYPARLFLVDVTASVVYKLTTGGYYPAWRP